MHSQVTSQSADTRCTQDCVCRAFPPRFSTHRDMDFVSGRPSLKHRLYGNPLPATPSARAKHTAHNERP